MRSDTRGEKEGKEERDDGDGGGGGVRKRRWRKEGSSEADKQNITARVTRKDPEEMKGLRLSLFLSLPPSPFPLPSPISLKMEEKEEEEKCTLLKHEWITKSRVHSFAPYRPRNPQKVYLSPRATMAYTLAWRRPTFLPSLLTPRPRGIVIGVLLNRYV